MMDPYNARRKSFTGECTYGRGRSKGLVGPLQRPVGGRCYDKGIWEALSAVALVDVAVCLLDSFDLCKDDLVPIEKVRGNFVFFVIYICHQSIVSWNLSIMKRLLLLNRIIIYLVMCPILNILLQLRTRGFYIMLKDLSISNMHIHILKALINHTLDNTNSTAIKITFIARAS